MIGGPPAWAMKLVKPEVAVSSAPDTPVSVTERAERVIIRGDRRRLARVVANLIDNARLHGVEDRIRFQTGDAARLLPGLRADLLFLDPPWGVEWNRLHTPLDALPALPPLLAVRVLAGGELAASIDMGRRLLRAAAEAAAMH